MIMSLQKLYDYEVLIMSFLTIFSPTDNPGAQLT